MLKKNNNYNNLKLKGGIQVMGHLHRLKDKSLLNKQVIIQIHELFLLNCKIILEIKTFGSNSTPKITWINCDLQTIV